MDNSRWLLLYIAPRTWLEKVIHMANPTLKLSDYTMRGDGAHLHFVAAVTGQHPSDVFLILAESDLVGVWTQDDLSHLIQTKLLTRLRAAVAATLLDGLINATWSV